MNITAWFSLFWFCWRFIFHTIHLVHVWETWTGFQQVSGMWLRMAAGKRILCDHSQQGRACIVSTLDWVKFSVGFLGCWSCKLCYVANLTNIFSQTLLSCWSFKVCSFASVSRGSMIFLVSILQAIREKHINPVKVLLTAKKNCWLAIRFNIVQRLCISWVQSR